MERGHIYSDAPGSAFFGGPVDTQCCAPFGGSSYKAFEALQQYWNLLLWRRSADGGPTRDGCFVPLRSAFDPMKIHRYLPDIYIAERKSDACLEVRVAGTVIDETSGFSLRGANFFEVCLPCERDFFVTVTGAMLKQACGMKIIRKITLKDGRVLKYSAMCFPLADEDGVPRYIVGMAKVAGDMTQSHFQPSDELRSEISSFSYIDIGAGLPSRPLLLQ